MGGAMDGWAGLLMAAVVCVYGQIVWLSAVQHQNLNGNSVVDFDLVFPLHVGKLWKVRARGGGRCEGEDGGGCWRRLRCLASVPIAGSYYHAYHVMCLDPPSDQGSADGGPAGVAVPDGQHPHLHHQGHAIHQQHVPGQHLPPAPAEA